MNAIKFEPRALEDHQNERGKPFVCALLQSKRGRSQRTPIREHA